MPAIAFTEEDINSGHLVREPGWYEYTVTKVNEKAAKASEKGPSTNYWVICTGKSGEMAGVEVLTNFNSKLLRLAVPYFKVCNDGKDLEKGKNYEFNDTIGVTIKGLTERGVLLSGAPVNKIVDWLAKK